MSVCMGIYNIQIHINIAGWQPRRKSSSAPSIAFKQTTSTLPNDTTCTWLYILLLYSSSKHRRHWRQGHKWRPPAPSSGMEYTTVILSPAFNLALRDCGRTENKFAREANSGSHRFLLLCRWIARLSQSLRKTKLASCKAIELTSYLIVETEFRAAWDESGYKNSWKTAFSTKRTDVRPIGIAKELVC
jgi:hypothetical protein